MTVFISLPKSKGCSIYRTIKVPNRNKKLVLQKHVLIAKVPIL